jgi:hypothetical protein
MDEQDEAFREIAKVIASKRMWELTHDPLGNPAIATERVKGPIPDLVVARGVAIERTTGGSNGRARNGHSEAAAADKRQRGENDQTT